MATQSLPSQDIQSHSEEGEEQYSYMKYPHKGEIYNNTCGAP